MVYEKKKYVKEIAEKVKSVPAPTQQEKQGGLFGNKRGLIQDSGNCGTHVPVVRHPPK